MRSGLARTCGLLHADGHWAILDRSSRLRTRPAMRDFVAELKRRKVIRVAIAYLAVSWLILQVGSMVIPAFNIPAWTLRLLVLLVVLGLPLPAAPRRSRSRARTRSSPGWERR